MNKEQFETLNPVGSSIDYHGRTGIITLYFKSNAIVYFEDINDEESIEIKELIEQNYG